MVKLKRVYDAPEPGDGRRVLVDRLWPRGLSRERAALDRWEKELAPSDALRRFYGHDPGRWEEFRARYLAELAQLAPLVEELRQQARREPVTLLYAARDGERSNAAVLKELLER